MPMRIKTGMLPLFDPGNQAQADGYYKTSSRYRFFKISHERLTLQYVMAIDLLMGTLLFRVLLQFSWRRGFKDSRVCYLKTLSALLPCFRFLLYLY